MIMWNKITQEEYKKIFDNIEIVSKKPRNKEKQNFYNAPFSFDIETTSFMENGEKRAIMYIWMFDLNGMVVYGRTWKQYIEFLNWINQVMNARMIVYVHNLAYEFQFMRKWFEWKKISARTERKVMSAEMADYNIEYKCSYFLSGYPLEKVAKNLIAHKIEKLVGSLDYSKKRGSRTPLSDEEMAYCEHDVVIIEYYIRELLEQWGNIYSIPLTQTSFVRRDISKRANENRKQTFKLISNLVLEPHVYQMAKDAYRGGFTHANAFKVGNTYENVGSYDFASSYPAVMFCETFPMSSAIDVEPCDYELALSKYHCLMYIEIKGIKSKFMNERIISFSKCKIINMKGTVLDNGRIYKADYLTICVTEIELNSIKLFYSYDELNILKMIAFGKGMLPHYMLLAICEYFQKKTMLKGIENSEAEYMHAKQLLNSMYGMCVTDICADEITYINNEWGKEKVDIKLKLSEYNHAQSRYLYYLWGIYVTAYATRNLFSGILSVGDDYIYSDTDSVKFENIEKHKEYFDAYNETQKQKNRNTCDILGIPYSQIEPLDKMGNTHYLGVWEYEGCYDRFKTLGAKRYITEKNGKISITVAGVNKKNGSKWLEKTFADPFEKFNQSLIFPAQAKDGDEKYSPSGKIVLTYIDEPASGHITDYRGKISPYEERSYIHMSNSTYEMDLGGQYLEFLSDLRTLDFNI